MAFTVFPGEIYRTPETWAKRAYRDLIYFHEVDKGGALRGMGATRANRRRNPRGVQITLRVGSATHKPKNPKLIKRRLKNDSNKCQTTK
jgi:hypothetical protein